MSRVKRMPRSRRGIVNGLFPYHHQVRSSSSLQLLSIEHYHFLHDLGVGA
jgi:hypothetical protein